MWLISLILCINFFMISLSGAQQIETQTPSKKREAPRPREEIFFADSVIHYDPGALGENTGDEPQPPYQKPTSALGLPDYDPDDDSGYVSLGNGGILVLQFTDNLLIDGPGPDLRIYGKDSLFEDILVWVSQDGTIFHPVGKATQENPSLDIAPYVEPGTSFPYIKLRDDPNNGDENDPALGADIDAVSTIHSALQIVIPADQIFHNESARFQPEAPQLLLPIIEKIDQYGCHQVSINAHTDDRGSADFNLILTQQWAGKIRDLFLDTTDLFTIECQALGWGESKPTSPNDDEEGRKQNRRIEIFLLIHQKE
jgi:OOP family OmpA-OmpF porin